MPTTDVFILTPHGVWSALLLALCSALSACAHKTNVSAPPATALVPDMSLGPGDVFEVRVYGEKDLTATYQVGIDGTTRFPFLGNVQVGGKEPDQVAREVAQLLKDGGFLVEPQVSVVVQHSNSKRISILGAVAKPGTLPITPGMTVVQAVSNAGGFTPLANKDETVVTRRIDGKLERYQISVSEVTRGNADDFLLRSGDIIFVPERVF